MLDPVFGRDCGHQELTDNNFDVLLPLTHVTAKMDHRSGLENTFWHHGVYCGTGQYLKSLAEELGIDMKPFLVPSGSSRVPLAQYLEENRDMQLICEYDGPSANGQLSSSSATSTTSATFKGRVTFNHCQTWQKLYRRVYQVIHTKAKLSEEEVLRNVFASLGREGYSVLFSNCEHHTTGCLTGAEQSHQARGGFALAGLGILAVAASGAAMYVASKKEEKSSTSVKYVTVHQKRGSADGDDEPQRRN